MAEAAVMERKDGRRGDKALNRDARALHEALSGLIRVYAFRDRDQICCHDLSVAQGYALDALGRQGPLTLNELAAELYLDKSTASRIVKGLERKGYAERSRHPDDARALQLALTAEGRAMRQRITAAMLDDHREILSDFDPGVRESMARLIARLADAAAARVDTSGGSCCRME